jgi:dCTP deaminase
MILTGRAIYNAWQIGDIDIEPFDPEFLNPNSYNYRLSNTLLLIKNIQDNNQQIVNEIHIGKEGFLLEPGNLYLGSTFEKIGSNTFVTILLGRSSIGRLGLYLNVTADLGHLGSLSRWTLEMTVVQPLIIYPLMKIGQVSFWVQDGPEAFYNGRYQGDSMPFPNKDQRLMLGNNDDS